jgi:ATP-dependent DNA helicase RecQ
LAGQPGPGIVYAPSRDKAEKLAEGMAASGRSALAYHAGLDPAVRKRNQAAFVPSEEMVMAATVAFGMGIDKPDVRLRRPTPAFPKSIEPFTRRPAAPDATASRRRPWLFWAAEDFRPRPPPIETEVEPARQQGEREAAECCWPPLSSGDVPAADPAPPFRRGPPRPAAIATIAWSRRRRSMPTEVARKCCRRPSGRRWAFGVAHLPPVPVRRRQ